MICGGIFLGICFCYGKCCSGCGNEGYFIGNIVVLGIGNFFVFWKCYSIFLIDSLWWFCIDYWGGSLGNGDWDGGGIFVGIGD